MFGRFDEEDLRVPITPSTFAPAGDKTDQRHAELAAFSGVEDTSIGRHVRERNPIILIYLVLSLSLLN